ncbi:MAG: tetratricopeptide repeat protein, partial [Dolichospermum sp.]
MLVIPLLCEQHSWQKGKKRDRQGEGNALGGLGLSYYYQEEYTQALNYTLKSLEIAREIKDLGAEGNALNNLGGIHFKFGNLGEAEKF